MRGRVLDPAAILLASLEDEVGCISGWASPDGSLEPLEADAFAEAFFGRLGGFIRVDAYWPLATIPAKVYS